MVALVAALIQLAAAWTTLSAARPGCSPAAIAVVAVLAVPAWPTHVERHGAHRRACRATATAGYFDEREHGDLLNSQVLATSTRPAETGDDLDLVVWPEGGSDRDPTRDASGRYVFDAITTGYDAPLLSGVITQSDDGETVYNSSLLWDDGEVQGPVRQEAPVPFGEYVPDRAFWRPFAPDLIDLIARDYTPGHATRGLSTSATSPPASRSASTSSTTSSSRT